MRYAVQMKYSTFYTAFLLLLLTSSANAEMYKHTDAEGVTTYTDTEVEGATQIKPPEGNTIKLPKYVAKNKPADDTKSDYAAFSIVSPQNDSTFRDNAGNLAVTLTLTPELNTAEGHSIAVYIDGKKAVSNSTSLAVTINNVMRGSHAVYAVVTDTNAKALIQSNNITVHFKQHSVLH